MNRQGSSDALLFDLMLAYEYVPKELARERLPLKLQRMGEVCLREHPEIDQDLAEAVPLLEMLLDDGKDDCRA